MKKIRITESKLIMLIKEVIEEQFITSFPSDAELGADKITPRKEMIPVKDHYPTRYKEIPLNQYTYKSDFPFPIYTKNEIIKTIQQKIGLPPDKQTGLHDPFTNLALYRVGYGMENGITKQIYNTIMGIK